MLFIYRRFSSADAPKILENGIPIESVNSGTKTRNWKIISYYFKGKMYSFFHQTCYFVNKNVFWSTYKSNQLSGHYFLELYTGYSSIPLHLIWFFFFKNFFKFSSETIIIEIELMFFYATTFLLLKIYYRIPCSY